MASAAKSLEREIHEHEEFLDSLVSAATTALGLAQQLIDLKQQIEARPAAKNQKAAKQIELLKGQQEKVTSEYLTAVRNFVALQARMKHMQDGLIKLLGEFQALANRVAALPGKVEEAGRRVHELQAAMQQMGITGSSEGQPVKDQ